MTHLTTLQDKVRFLSAPDSYGPEVRSVQPRETHMSWVFLTPDRVYKLKKPLKRPFLDFSTIRRRRSRQRIVHQIDLTDGHVVGSPPIAVDESDFLVVEHRYIPAWTPADLRSNRSIALGQQRLGRGPGE